MPNFSRNRVYSSIIDLSYGFYRKNYRLFDITMNRIKARKLVKKVIRSLIIAAIAIYLGFNWYVNLSVDQFFETLASDFDIEHGQAWADLSGNLYISDIELYEQGDYPVITISSIQANFDSTGDLLGLTEYAAYQTFPRHLKISINDVQTSDAFNLYNRLDKLDLPFNPAIIPPACKSILSKPPSPISFSSNASFTFNLEERLFLFDAYIDTIALADVNLTGQISDIENGNLMSGFLENITVKVTDFIWLQQSLNQCRNNTHQPKIGQLAETFVKQMQKVASDNYYELSSNLVSQYRSFINLPEKISLSFSPALDQTWQGLQKLPIHEITQKSTVSLALNQSEVDEIIASVDYVGFAREQKQQEKAAAPVVTSSFLPVNYQGLRRFVGTQVIVHFKNRNKVRGTIERLTPGRVYLSAYKFGGKSVLPYSFGDIYSIEIQADR